MPILLIKWWCNNKMKVKIGSRSEKPKHNAPNTLRNVIDKFKTNKTRNVAHFLAVNNNSHTTVLAKTQRHSNTVVSVESVRQQCNGLLYANITKIR